MNREREEMARRRRARREAGEASFLAENPDHPQKAGRPLCWYCRKRLGAFIGFGPDESKRALCRKCLPPTGPLTES